MEQNKVNQYMMMYNGLVPEEKTLYLKKALNNAKDDAEENLAILKTKNPILILIFSILFGVIGVDRFMLGDVGLGICKLLFGGLTLFIWPIIDIFLCYQKAKEKNLQQILTALN